MKEPWGFVVTCLAIAMWTSVCIGQENIEPAIDEFIETVLSCSDIPGLALTVVRDGQPYLAKGYGIKDTSTGEPMEGTTRLLLASVSKAISGASMATVLREQDRDEVWWDTPLRDLLGDEFYMNDATRTQQSHLRDIFAHRMGLPEHNDLRMSGYSLEEFVSRLRFLEFDYDFRDRYRYNNILYSTAELTLEALSGRQWWDVLQEKLFVPLGMVNSTLIIDESVWDSMATGYYEDGANIREVSKLVPKAYYGIFGMSGGVVSTAEDVTQWILFQLNEGYLPNGTEILSDAQFRDTHVDMIQRTASPSWSRPEYPVTYLPPRTYSTGWQETSYRDYSMYSHDGSQGGYLTHLVIEPSAGHGVFVGVNKSPDGNVRDLVAMYVLDLLMGETPWLSTDTVCDLVETRMTSQRNGRCADCSVDVEQFLLDTKTRLGLNVPKPEKYAPEDYVGVYGDYAYGNVTISLDGDTGGLIMQYGVENYTFDMVETEPQIFNAVGREPFWFREYGLVFEMDTDLATAVTISFDPDFPPRFVRGLDFNNPPPPPELCP